MDFKIDKNKIELDKIIKRKISQISKGYQNKVESALESVDMEGKTPLNKKQYGDPDIIAHKYFYITKEERRRKTKRNNAQAVLKYI